MANSPEKKKGSLPEPLDSIWNALNSLPIAIVAMLLLAILSALGTVIPQEHLAQPRPGQTMEQMYEAKFGTAVFNEISLGSQLKLKIPINKHALIESFGFKHIYFTPYFFILLVWLSVSAIVCNITRFKRTVRQWREPRVVHSRGFFKGSKRSTIIELEGNADPAQFSKALAGAKFRTVTKADDEATHIYADRGFLKKWALVLLHFSILVLIFGGVYGKIYGVESYVRLADGEKRALTLDLYKGKLPLVKPLIDKVPELTYNLDQSRFRIDYVKNITVPSHLQGIPEEFQDYYRYFVKDFVSELTIERNGKSITREVKVNHPIKLDKLVMYQSGYQQSGYISVTIDGKSTDYFYPQGILLAIGNEGLIDANRAIAAGADMSTTAFTLDTVKAGDLYEAGEKVGYIGPLTICRMIDTRTGNSLGSMLLTPENGFETNFKGNVVDVKMSTKVDNYSDFSYKRDPGIPILYFGWIAMIIGITIAMYIPYSQVWLRLEKGKAYAMFAGRASREEIDSLTAKWNDILNTR